MSQLVLHFDGRTYDPELDHDRLKSALGRVYEAMKGGQWFTLRELAEQAGCSEAGASARLRDLRKERFGSHRVESRRRSGGTWEYRLG